MASIFEFFRSPITLRRFSQGSYVDGLWVEGTYFDETITASIQPLSGEDMKELPEGRRLSVGYKMFTSTKINTVLEAGKNINADHVLFDNKEFEVYQVKVWKNKNFAIVDHYSYFVLKI